MNSRFYNAKLMNVTAENEKLWNQSIMPGIHINRIIHGRKVSSMGTPIVKPHPEIPGLCILDMYFFNKVKGEYRRNSDGEIVFGTMYRYLIDYPALLALFAGESIGQNYNFAIKQASRIERGVKMLDFKDNHDLAPTMKDLAKEARKSPMMRR